MHLSASFRQVHFCCLVAASYSGAAPRPSCPDFANPKSEQEDNTMEITIKINGRMTVVEVSAEVAECMDAGRRKAENQIGRAHV